MIASIDCERRRVSFSLLPIIFRFPLPRGFIQADHCPEASLVLTYSVNTKTICTVSEKRCLSGETPKEVDAQSRAPVNRTPIVTVILSSGIVDIWDCEQCFVLYDAKWSSEQSALTAGRAREQPYAGYPGKNFHRALCPSSANSFPIRPLTDHRLLDALSLSHTHSPPLSLIGHCAAVLASAQSILRKLVTVTVTMSLMMMY